MKTPQINPAVLNSTITMNKSLSNWLRFTPMSDSSLCHCFISFVLYFICFVNESSYLTTWARLRMFTLVGTNIRVLLGNMTSFMSFWFYTSLSWCAISYRRSAIHILYFINILSAGCLGPWNCGSEELCGTHIEPLRNFLEPCGFLRPHLMRPQTFTNF